MCSFTHCSFLDPLFMFVPLLLCFKEIIRTVLGNLDDLQPFSSTHYIIFPCILHLCIIFAFKRLSSLNLTHYFSTYATKLI